MTVSFAFQKLLSFRRSHLFIDGLIICVTWVIFGKGLLCPCIEGYFPLSSLSGSVWSVYIEVFNPFGLQFCVW